MLQLADGPRVEEMILAARPELIAAADFEFRGGFGNRLLRVIVFQFGFARQHGQSDAFNARGRSGEIAIH